METQRQSVLHARGGSGRFRWMMAAAVLLAAGCSDSDPLQPDPGEGPGAGDAGIMPTSAMPFARRVDLDFEAVGSFRPGIPVNVVSIARGRRPAEDMDFSLVVLDEETQPGSPPPAREVQQTRGALGKGAERRLNASLTFAKPGIYRVVASARSRAPENETRAAGDSIVGNFSSQTLYLYIGENGGWATKVHDPEMAGGRTTLYGSYGPFTGGTAATNVSLRSEVAQQTTGVVNGIFYVYNDSTRTHERLGYTSGYADCRTSTGSTQRLNFTVNSDGAFTFTCATGIYTGRIDLRNSDAEVFGAAGAFAGAAFDQTAGAQPALQASNQYAGYVFSTYNKHVPAARALFGRSRPAAITTWVSATDGSYPIQYCQAINTSYGCTRADVIMQNHTRVFDEDGIFVTMHEYGHSFHHRAIEALPGTYSCNPNGHSIDVPYSLSCAFVEGFADFFAVYLLSSRLTNTWYSDYTFESRSFAGPSGLITEGAAAGFFYDLVDGTGQTDSYSNTVSEESFDNAAYPASFIANIIANCAPYYRTSTGAYVYTYNLDGMDQVVYCIEGNVNAETVGPTYGTGWRTTWEGVTWSPTFSYPTGYSATTVRKLWTWNFYGV
jgi:hypothetical protein